MIRLQSLRARLLLTVSVATLLVWSAAGVVSYFKALHEADELMDGQLAQSARLLLAQAMHETARRWAVAGFAMGIMAAVPSTAAWAGNVIELGYVVDVAGSTVLKASYRAEISDGSFEASLFGKTSGVYKFSTDKDIRSCNRYCSNSVTDPLTYRIPAAVGRVPSCNSVRICFPTCIGEVSANIYVCAGMSNCVNCCIESNS